MSTFLIVRREIFPPTAQWKGRAAAREGKKFLVNRGRF